MVDSNSFACTSLRPRLGLLRGTKVGGLSGDVGQLGVSEESTDDVEHLL